MALIRGSRKAANPAGVPIVQSRIAPSGVATMVSPYSGAIVSTALIKRSICGTLSRCRLRYLRGARHLLDHLVQIHPHHRIAVDQLLELHQHRMKHDLLVGRNPFPVPGQPVLQGRPARATTPPGAAHPPRELDSSCRAT